VRVCAAVSLQRQVRWYGGACAVVVAEAKGRQAVVVVVGHRRDAVS